MMAHLSVYGSVTKKKAVEDAKKMQVVVAEECQKAGQETPPYMLQELIGKGSFGRVYKASDLKTSRVVAVKIIDIEESDTLNPKLADTYSEFLKEVNALKLLSESSAKNINHVVDALPVGQSMWMVTEYCAGGSVATLMKPTAPGGLQEKWIIPILREVAEAIFWVHKAGIIHRDIKCANVLITETGGVQLCDFGVSGVIETRFDKRSTFIGTPHWMAPELFDPSASYGCEVDIWAFGSMVFEIASGLPPNVMAGIDVTQLGSYLKQHTPRLEGNKYSDKLKDLVSFCLVEDPSKRPIIEEVQHHPYLFNTENSHPTSSLAMLVRAFRVWEAQGGSRKSLFALGGAQGPSDLASTAMANDEWNFSTTVDFDQRVMSNTDAQAVYDVYGSQVELADMPEFTPSSFKPKRRRPPPNLPVMKAPLEKIFDPNTISNYEENARAYYGKPMLPPASDLPLRDNSHNSTLRESLIDLDASLHGGRLSKFVDMDTIKIGPRRSRDYEFGEPDEYARGPNSDPETVLASSNRRTQEWKFPSMAPLSANPEMSHFPFNDSNSHPGSARPPLHHHTTEPLGLGQDFSSDNYLMAPRAASSQDNRASMSSLIDLDESVPEVAPPEIPRPSTANSDVISEVGSAFDLERHTSYIPLPSTNREPSIYVSDDSDLAGSFGAQQHLPLLPFDVTMEEPRRGRTLSTTTDIYIDDAHLYPGSGDEYMMTNQTQSSSGYSRDVSANGGGEREFSRQTARRSMSIGSRHDRTPSQTSSINSMVYMQQQQQAADGRPMPPLPGPPNENVMMGAGGRAIREDFFRLLEGMNAHLKFTGEYVADLPVRKAGRGGDVSNGIGGGFE